jgi:hypothetical protein
VVRGGPRLCENAVLLVIRAIRFLAICGGPPPAGNSVAGIDPIAALSGVTCVALRPLNQQSKRALVLRSALSR